MINILSASINDLEDFNEVFNTIRLYKRLLAVFFSLLFVKMNVYCQSFNLFYEL